MAASKKTKAKKKLAPSKASKKGKDDVKKSDGVVSGKKKKKLIVENKCKNAVKAGNSRNQKKKIRKSSESVKPVVENKKAKKGKSEIKWTIGGETINQPGFAFPESTKYCGNLSVTDYFELFFDDTLLELIINECTEYCMCKNWPDVNLSKGELRAFFGILILSGYNKLPGKPMYWSLDKDMGNEAVSETMRRDRFDDIMQSLHFISSTNLDTGDCYSCSI